MKHGSAAPYLSSRAFSDTLPTGPTRVTKKGVIAAGIIGLVILSVLLVFVYESYRPVNLYGNAEDHLGPTLEVVFQSSSGRNYTSSVSGGYWSLSKVPNHQTYHVYVLYDYLNQTPSWCNYGEVKISGNQAILPSGTHKNVAGIILTCL
ncbi:MAG: hypothetical protein M1587_01710 [Thaumarchaeota archaeon]|nr:hypothetical protein [Nitrososphaerota archaeon]